MKLNLSKPPLIMPNPNGHGALKTLTTLFFPLVTQTLVPNPNGLPWRSQNSNHSFLSPCYPNPNAQSKWPWSSQNSNHSFLSPCYPNPNAQSKWLWSSQSSNHSFLSTCYPNPNAQSKWLWSSQSSNHSFLSTCYPNPPFNCPTLHYTTLNFLHWSEWHRAPPLTKGPVSLVVKESLLL